jgi:hypothetical protein
VGDTSYGGAPALANVDVDAEPEIVVQLDENIYALNADGSNVPGFPVTLPNSPQYGYKVRNSAPVIGDIDGDGAQDIVVVANGWYSSYVFAYHADGLPLAGFPKTLKYLGSGAVPAIADIDLDGRNELVVTGDYWDGNPGDYDKVWVYDLHGAGPYGGIEWGQFGRDASHKNFYGNAPVVPPQDNQAPIVNITNPKNGAIIKRNTQTVIAATATDNVGVAKVEFRVNNTLLCTDTTASYTCLWKPTVRGKYKIEAKAYDTASPSNTATSTVNVTVKN